MIRVLVIGIYEIVKESDSGDISPSRQLGSYYQSLTGEVCTNRVVPINAEMGVLKGLK